jgi:hypothetical protein
MVRIVKVRQWFAVMVAAVAVLGVTMFLLMPMFVPMIMAAARIMIVRMRMLVFMFVVRFMIMFLLVCHFFLRPKNRCGPMQSKPQYLRKLTQPLQTIQAFSRSAAAGD